MTFTKQKDYDRMPYKLFEIVTIPITDDDSKRVLMPSKKFKVTGKVVYYQTVGYPDGDCSQLLQILGEEAIPVFSIDLGHVFTCRLLMVEDTAQRHSNPSKLKVVHNGTK